MAGQLPDTRLVLVAGPRLDPRELASHPRIEVRPFVPDLYEHHAAVDLAIVQGGLTTTMELAAFQTPFFYFPLRNHFEQQHFVAGAWSGSAPACGWTTTEPRPRHWEPRWSPTSGNPCATPMGRSTGPRGRRG